MHSTLDFLLRHGYVVLLGWVFAEQIGLPVPSLPLLLAAGALAGTPRLNFFFSLFLLFLSSVVRNFPYAKVPVSAFRRVRFLTLGRHFLGDRLRLRRRN